MPTTDIRIELSLKDHRKLKRLIRIIGIGAMHHLVMLWLATAAQCPNGHLKGWTDEDIADAAQWPKDTKTLIDALTSPDCLWLERNGDGYYIHDWPTHQPWVVGANARSEHARKAAEAKYSKRSSEHPRSKPRASSEQAQNTEVSIGDPLSILGASPEHPRRSAPSPLPTLPIQPIDNITSSVKVSSDVTLTSKAKYVLAQADKVFDKIVPVHSRKDGAKAGREKFRDIIKCGDMTLEYAETTFIELLTRRNEMPDWKEQGGKFVPTLEALFKDDRWKTEVKIAESYKNGEENDQWLVR